MTNNNIEASPIRDHAHKTNVYRTEEGFIAKCICGWQSLFKKSEYLLNGESSAKKDAELSAMGHLANTEQVRAYLSRIGTKGGKAKSPKKSLSSSNNGKKGGRPIAPIAVDMLIDE